MRRPGSPDSHSVEGAADQGPIDVTVITPTFRRELQVVEAIRSVLSQQGVSVEIFVFDDAPEGTAQSAVTAIDDPRVHYTRRQTPSAGKPALVRNEAIESARGRYLYFLDDDDRVLPGALAALVSALDASGAGVGFGTVAPFGEHAGIRARYQEWFEWAARTARRFAASSWLTTGIILFRGTLIINSTCMIRRECATALGGYDATIPVYEDVEFFARGIRRFGHVFVDIPVLGYRTGAPSLIHDLKGDESLVQRSYEIIHRKYKETHGLIEYRVLQAICKVLPLSVPFQGHAPPTAAHTASPPS